MCLTVWLPNMCSYKIYRSYNITETCELQKRVTELSTKINKLEEATQLVRNDVKALIVKTIIATRSIQDKSLNKHALTKALCIEEQREDNVVIAGTKKTDNDKALVDLRLSKIGISTSSSIQEILRIGKERHDDSHFRRRSYGIYNHLKGHFKGYPTEEIPATLPSRGRPVGELQASIKLSIDIVKCIKFEHSLIIELLDSCVSGCYYSPTISDANIVEEISFLLSYVPNKKPAVLAGDFNARINSQMSVKSRMLLESLSQLGFHIYSEGEVMTYCSFNGSTLTWGNIRKHIPVNIIVNCERPIPLLLDNEITSRTIDAEKITQLHLFELCQLVKNGHLNESYNHFCRILRMAFPASMGKQYIHNNGKIFDRYEIKKLRRRVLMVKHQLKNQPIKRKLYLTLRNQYVSKVQRAINKSRYQKEQRWLRDAETQRWKLLLRRNGSITSNINMDVWYSHFSEMLDDHKDTVVENYINELNIDFTMLEIFGEISRSPNHKAAGDDLVCNEQLKFTLRSLARELLLSFLRISEDKREQAIKPLAQILEFTDRQVDEVISLSKSSWFTNRMSLPSHVESKQNSGQSLAELLIKYMDKETRPDMHVKFHNDVKRMQSD
ncbi:hypothetical protein GJ496_004907 [Pomphorhynchus laevis]|nr:hypothetical protein GJ496_004907 [Pomphorhynchus laevis]